MVIRRSLTVLLALAMLAPATPTEPARVAFQIEPTPVRRPFVIGAAGDIACPSEPNGPATPRVCQYDDTARLIRGLDHVLPLGDNQYDRGAYRAYVKYFDPTWGRYQPKLSPVPGNHDHGNDPTSTPRGYFRYFGARVRGPDRLGYYSFDLGACPDDPCWHAIALNSELCFAPGGCGPASDQTDPGAGNRMHAWLLADLATHPNERYPCTLAFWHHPMFSFSTGSGATSAVRPVWDALYAARADVVLNGHSHNYQRWRPQAPDGARDRLLGIRQFVVGTGGARLYPLASGPRPRNLAAAQAEAFGLLRITLKAAGYRWAWASAPGQPSFDDSSRGITSCV